MGIRGEIYSTKVILPNRTYFFNIKENRMGDLYLNIVESKNRENGGFDRQSVIFFEEDMQEFLKGFDEALRIMEKEVRNKRKTGDKPKKVRSDKFEKDKFENKNNDRRSVDKFDKTKNKKRLVVRKN